MAKQPKPQPLVERTAAVREKAVAVFTGKYGVPLLTLIHLCLALLVVTISRKWAFVNASEIQSDYMTLYLLDYRVGFVSRALVGSVLSLFTDHPTVRMVSTIFISAIMAAMLLISILQAKLVKKALQQPGDASRSALAVSALHVLNAALWSGLFENIGLLDVYMIDVMLLYCLVADCGKYTRYWLAPIVCFIGLLIHTAFFFGCVPIICAILWYDLLERPKPDRLKIALFGVTCAVSVVVFILFVFFTRELVRVDEATLGEMLREKYDGRGFEEYFEGFLFMRRSSDNFDAGSSTDIIGYMHAHSSFFSGMRTKYILYIAPVIALFGVGCVYGARKTGARLIACLGFAAPLLALFPEFYISSDDSRFYAMYMIAQYLGTHYLFTQKDAFLLPNADAVLPGKKRSKYARELRAQRIRRARIALNVAGLAYLLLGMKIL